MYSECIIKIALLLIIDKNIIYVAHRNFKNRMDFSGFFRNLLIGWLLFSPLHQKSLTQNKIVSQGPEQAKKRGRPKPSSFWF
jgi:hypothetical protein